MLPFTSPFLDDVAGEATLMERALFHKYLSFRFKQYSFTRIKYFRDLSIEMPLLFRQVKEMHLKLSILT